MIGRSIAVWTTEELCASLMSTWEQMYKQEPEAAPFREPVDAELLGLVDYHDIIKRPMDLSTIRRKLEGGEYRDPWAYIDDVWLMLDNAWLYNRKMTKVYKFCSKV
jgi:E1A/CREB-binding protein